MARSSLADALKPRAPTPAADEPQSQTYRPPSRRGRKLAPVYLDSAAHLQLRMLGLETSRSVQNLLIEAINDLFQKHGKARIAD